MTKENLPPLGLKPRYIHDEQRLSEIRQAIYRYLNEFYLIDEKWIEEYNEIVSKSKGVRND